MAAKKRKKKALEEIEEAPKKNDWQALVAYVRENPVLSTVGTAFVLLCILAGLLYRANTTASEKEICSQYARALNIGGVALRAAQLAPLAETSSRWTPEAVYMMGEAAYGARDFEKAKTAFMRVRQEFPEARFTPDAVEGLGYIAENEEDYEGALAYYQEIHEKWPNSFAGVHQDLNIARCQERLGNLAEAVQAYQVQVDVFPDSTAATDAQQALDRLKTGHPDLFPEEEPEEQADQPAEEAPEAQPEVAPEEAAPAEATPEQLPAEQPVPEEPPAEPPAEQPAEQATPEQPPVDGR